MSTKNALGRTKMTGRTSILTIAVLVTTRVACAQESLRVTKISEAQVVGLGQPGLVPTSGALSPRWELAAQLFTFQGLAPLATNPGSSGAETSNAHDDRNAGTSSNTITWANWLT